MDNSDHHAAAPPTLNHVIGQQRVVQQLKVALDAHFNDRSCGCESALPHLLFAGPAGTGKSLLASIISRELGSGFHEELAQNLERPSHMHGLLMLAEAGDVIFVDEIQELPGNIQTSLLRSLEERRLFLGGDRKAVTLPPFTFIGATTDEWALSKPLRDRFKITLHLVHYTDDEMVHLIAQRAKGLHWAIAEGAIKGIASRGRGTPRIAIRLLESARRTARAEGADTITSEHLKRTCDIDGYDVLGLDVSERRYLELLRQAQGPLRLNVIATQMGLPRRTIEAVIETELIRLGLVTKDDDGRVLTAAGAKHLIESNS